MSIYSFSKSPILSDITFRTTENGSVRAYIAARPEADTAEAAKVLETMRKKGYTCTPFMFDGKPMLEVRAFGSEKKLIETLKPWTNGKPDIKLEDADKLTWTEKFRKRTLQLSGLTYIIGDIGFFSYGYKEADRLVMAASVAYFLGTLSLVFYGRNDQSDLQIRDLSQQLEGFLCQQGAALPKDSALHHMVEEKPKDLLQSAHEFGKRYPSEMFNSVTAIAGLFIAASSYKKLHGPTHGMDAKSIQSHLTEARMDVGLGVLTALSGTFATLVKEKKPDPDAPPKKGMEWLWQQIQAHPLAIAGGGYSIATLCHAASTYNKYQNARRITDRKAINTVMGRALFVLAALTSEMLLAISSKGHGEGVVSDNSVDNTAIAIAADFIARQPKEQQDPLINATAEFLGSEKRLAIKNEDIVTTLHQQIEAINQNPWVAAERKEKAAAADAPVAPAEEPAAATPAAWQAKIAASQPAQPSLSA